MDEDELRAGQQRIMAEVDAIREMLGRTLNSGNDWLGPRRVTTGPFWIKAELQ